MTTYYLPRHLPFFGLVPGVVAIAVLTVFANLIANSPVITELSISPLIIGILLGALIGNTCRNYIPESCRPGFVFSSKTLLRLAIILYGFHITFGEINDVGLESLLLDLIIVSSVLAIGIFVGTKLLGMDEPLAIMTATGAAICGAAAVIATEPMLKTDSHKTAMAIMTVVIFGTLSMFLYPLFFHSGLTTMPDDVFGIYIGATVHEVAHVVGASHSVSAAASDNAIIVKMTRVMLLAPALLMIGWWLKYRYRTANQHSTPIAIPWFAIGFIGIAGFNSLDLLMDSTVSAINTLDTYLLTMAMTALGLDVIITKFKELDLTPLYLASILFAWLTVGGFGLTTLIVGN